MNDELLFNHTYVTKNFASIEVQDARDNAKFIEKFDQGHLSVMITDNGKFKGLVDRNIFQRNFENRNLAVILDAWIEYSDNEYDLKMKAIEIFKRSILREIPVLKDDQIVSTVVNSISIGSAKKLNAVEFPPLYWNLISDDLAKNLFGDKKILISSNCGSLSGFKERFDHLAQCIDVYSDDNWISYQNGQYDLFLSGLINMGGGGILH
ncbi:MAG: hypothetical protein IJ728_04650 [Selenomonadaceae bacterium]|nr:hypothetical protein [Selenomonadaceae bacterium]